MTEMNTIDLAALHAASFVTPRPWSEREFEGLLSMRGVFLVTGSGPSFAMGRVVEHEAELLTLAVAPEARGQGLGRAILEAYEDAAKTREAITSFLEVSEHNIPAIALYKTADYRESGRRKFYYTTPDRKKLDALLFSKRLKHT